MYNRCIESCFLLDGFRPVAMFSCENKKIAPLQSGEERDHLGNIWQLS